MRYISQKHIKAKAKELGYRTNAGFFHTLDVAIEKMIVGAVEWTRPKKTLSREALLAYLE